MPSAGSLANTNIARRQLSLFLQTAEIAGLGHERVRRLLRLSQDNWRQWLGILADQPMPQEPALPVLLRHLGYVTSRLDRSTRAYA